MYKDSEKCRYKNFNTDLEYKREWRKKNPEDKEKRREYNRVKYLRNKKKDPNYKPQDSYHDFETHRELAINSGIQSQREWFECFKMGLFPDGIYSQPNHAFGRY